MWKASRHDHYNDFRVFIMGVKGNEEMFESGVVYEGVPDENGVLGEPKAYRGQTGAQDDIIPTMDIVTGVSTKVDHEYRVLLMIACHLIAVHTLACLLMYSTEFIFVNMLHARPYP
jgi:hypothetical protein